MDIDKHAEASAAAVAIGAADRKISANSVYAHAPTLSDSASSVGGSPADNALWSAAYGLGPRKTVATDRAALEPLLVFLQETFASLYDAHEVHTYGAGAFLGRELAMDHNAVIDWHSPDHHDHSFLLCLNFAADKLPLDNSAAIDAGMKRMATLFTRAACATVRTQSLSDGASVQLVHIDGVYLLLLQVLESRNAYYCVPAVLDLNHRPWVPRTLDAPLVCLHERKLVRDVGHSLRLRGVQQLIAALEHVCKMCTVSSTNSSVRIVPRIVWERAVAELLAQATTQPLVLAEWWNKQTPTSFTDLFRRVAARATTSPALAFITDNARTREWLAAVFASMAVMGESELMGHFNAHVKARYSHVKCVPSLPFAASCYDKLLERLSVWPHPSRAELMRELCIETDAYKQRASAAAAAPAVADPTLDAILRTAPMRAVVDAYVDVCDQEAALRCNIDVWRDMQQQQERLELDRYLAHKLQQQIDADERAARVRQAQIDSDERCAREVQAWLDDQPRRSHEIEARLDAVEGQRRKDERQARAIFDADRPTPVRAPPIGTPPPRAVLKTVGPLFAAAAAVAPSLSPPALASSQLPVRAAAAASASTHIEQMEHDASSPSPPQKLAPEPAPAPAPQESAAAAVALECVVCMDAERTHLGQCGHLSMCEACATQPDMRECPICRAPIGTLIKLFRV